MGGHSAQCKGVGPGGRGGREEEKGGQGPLVSGGEAEKR